MVLTFLRKTCLAPQFYIMPECLNILCECFTSSLEQLTSSQNVRADGRPLLVTSLGFSEALRPLLKPGLVMSSHASLSVSRLDLEVEENSPPQFPLRIHLCATKLHSTQLTSNYLPFVSEGI